MKKFYAFGVTLVLFWSPEGFALSSQTQLKSYKIGGIGLCTAVLLGIVGIKSQNKLPIASEQVPPPQDFALAPESSSPSFDSTDIFSKLIVAQEQNLSEASASTKRGKMDWILQLIKSKPFRYDDSFRTSSRHPFVEEFLNALQRGDSNVAEFYREVLEQTDDWCPLDFFNSFEQIVDEPGHQEWNASIQLPNSTDVWNISYKEVAGPPDDPESKEITTRVYPYESKPLK